MSFLLFFFTPHLYSLNVLGCGLLVRRNKAFVQSLSLTDDKITNIMQNSVTYKIDLGKKSINWMTQDLKDETVLL